MLEALAYDDPDDRRRRALELADRRAAGEPLQYVLGRWPFRGLDLVVDTRALIPRPETEGLVELALAVLESSDARVACDLGCGTGAIALSLAVEARALGRAIEVHATDVSTDALALARHNAQRVGALAVRFHEGSWYEALPDELEGRVDLLCANPPYVGWAERETLARELDFEPTLALVADDGRDGTQGMAAIEEVLAGAQRWLAPHGTVLVEHGARQHDAVVASAHDAGLHRIVDHVDLAGLPRVLEARGGP